MYEGLCIFVTTFVTNLTMVTFTTKVINVHMVCMVGLVLWLFSVMHNFHTGSGTHLDAYCTGTEVFFWGQSGWGVMLPTHIHLALRLRTCRAMSLLPQHASMACAVTTVSFCGVCSDNYIFLHFCVVPMVINPLNPELNPMCCLLALLGAHHFLHVSRIRVKSLTFRRLSHIYIYIYICVCVCGAPILDVSRSHTTTQHSR